MKHFVSICLLFKTLCIIFDVKYIQMVTSKERILILEERIKSLEFLLAQKDKTIKKLETLLLKSQKKPK